MDSEGRRKGQTEGTSQSYTLWEATAKGSGDRIFYPTACSYSPSEWEKGFPTVSTDSLSLFLVFWVSQHIYTESQSRSERVWDRILWFDRRIFSRWTQKDIHSSLSSSIFFCFRPLSLLLVSQIDPHDFWVSWSKKRGRRKGVARDFWDSKSWKNIRDRVIRKQKREEEE